jgi:hypothetical protein
MKGQWHLRLRAAFGRRVVGGESVEAAVCGG